MLAAGALLVTGCAHHSEADEHAQSAVEHTKDAFGEAYDAVKEGGRDVAHTGKYVMERTREGAVRVVDRTRTSSAGRYANDAWITTRLKSAYSVDRDVPVTRVHVTTQDGVVTLSGVVDHPYQAERAIAKALDTPGVVAVTSNLAWPEHHQAKTYAPGEHM
jgi:osmotically-inducible protein OsmY